MRKKLYVAGTDLSTFGVYVSGQGTFGAPKKSVTTYSVSKRDGLLLGVNERLENIEVTYPAFVYSNFASNLLALRVFLAANKGYLRIEDDYDTDHYRLGFFEAGIEPEVFRMNNAGRFDLTFNCLPQRWLKSGETVISKTSTGNTTVTNPTPFVAKPLIRAYGSGSFSIAPVGASSDPVGVYVSISTSYPYIDIDCETMQLSYDGDNANMDVTFARRNTGMVGVDAPVFVPGDNAVYIAPTSTITKLEITPRWWEV